MVFSLLGRLIRRVGWLIILAWILLLAGTGYLAPPWNEVAQDKEFAFLPDTLPSRQAEKIYAEAFPDDRSGSNIVLVLHRAGAGREHLKNDLKFIESNLEPGLRKLAAEEGGLASEPSGNEDPLFAAETKPTKTNRSIINRIRTPNAPGGGSLLISNNGQAFLVVLELTTEFLSNVNWPTIVKVQKLVGQFQREGQIPSGLEISLTGSAVIGRDHTLAELKSARTTEILTVVLVIGLLAIIYRSPLLAIIPLLTVFIAIRLSINVLAILGGAGYLTLFQGIQTYITILAYGPGVDYCLFLMARYKEELESDECGAKVAAKPANPIPEKPKPGSATAPHDAIACAVEGVGAALTASAATVICGIGMMVFAEFGKFREAGWAIPISIAIVLCATLTFTPALLRLTGKWAFWPMTLGRVSSQKNSSSAWKAFRQGNLQHLWVVMGERLLRQPGKILAVTAGIMAPFAILAGVFYDRLSYDLIGDLPGDSVSVTGTKVMQEHFPAGLMGPVGVLIVHRNADFSSPQGRANVETITERLKAQKEALGLADIRSLSAPLGITPAAANPLSELDIPPEVLREALSKGAVERYASSLGGRNYTGTRLELILQDSPFSHHSIESLKDLERAVVLALPPDLEKDFQLYLVGMTTSVRDMSEVMQRDRLRIEILVLASVFLILIVLLRRVVVTIYLLLSVLFNYYTTLGVSIVFFWLLDPHNFSGIDWKVAIFLFTILIAVGEDYNIFLLTRVDEESKTHGPVRGVTEGLQLTGPIISSCGIIMAGTFASLLAGSLAELRQLGFALAFGVLLDTFVIRPILVPAFLILLHSGRLPWLTWGKSWQAESPVREPAKAET